MNFIVLLADNLTLLADNIPKIVGSAAILAAFLPPPAEHGTVLAKVHWAINKLAFNFAHAKNEGTN